MTSCHAMGFASSVAYGASCREARILPQQSAKHIAWPHQRAGLRPAPIARQSGITEIIERWKNFCALQLRWDLLDN
ncbi:hypothetical protein RRG08_024049 [Elysia crispata]|uniref:Uncharacterized protein n=1 Tax=Elysia crispata TaxID=231223 RepID=A0AAE0ZNZ2_9GAST|nr:hypothetical protein RRG08_024049 [Elysia crispata]